MTDPKHQEALDFIRTPDQQKVFENETIVDPSAQRTRYRVTCAAEFNATPEEQSMWEDPEQESEHFEALTMAHALGVNEKNNPFEQTIVFKVEKFVDGAWEDVYDHGNP
jgi:hypothetical protein